MITVEKCVEEMIDECESKFRLSESFPPDSKNNFVYIAEVHKYLRNLNLDDFNLR